MARTDSHSPEHHEEETRHTAAAIEAAIDAAVIRATDELGPDADAEEITAVALLIDPRLDEFPAMTEAAAEEERGARDALRDDESQMNKGDDQDQGPQGQDEAAVAWNRWNEISDETDREEGRRQATISAMDRMTTEMERAQNPTPEDEDEENGANGEREAWGITIDIPIQIAGDGCRQMEAVERAAKALADAISAATGINHPTEIRAEVDSQLDHLAECMEETDQMKEMDDQADQLPQIAAGYGTEAIYRIKWTDGGTVVRYFPSVEEALKMMKELPGAEVTVIALPRTTEALTQWLNTIEMEREETR